MTVVGRTESKSQMSTNDYVCAAILYGEDRIQKSEKAMALAELDYYITIQKKTI
jgi:hypothetical protein